MHYFKRHIDQELLAWKESEQHKPLLLRGARQVGKSSAVKELGKKFTYFIEVNLERNITLQELFGAELNIETICAQLSAIFKKPIIPGETLLFIDEIQVSQRAIASLRYFYEEMPDLHVIAAGSLLEFALNDLPSFGVGRIHSLYMYPFSFDEFLLAQGHDGLLALKQQADSTHPLSEAIHQELVKQLRSFYLVGGMPEAVKAWIATGDYMNCARIQQDILLTYQDDFKKYKTRILPEVLKKTLHSVAKQAGQKFVYAQVDSSLESRVVKQALSLLSLAGLIIPVTHTSANGLPLGAETNEKYQKYLFLDIGLMQKFLALQPTDILIGDEMQFVNKGGLSEMFAGLELVKYGSYELPAEMYYWQRAERNAMAEVDYLITVAGKIIPIEVKAGTQGSMQSLRVFIAQKHPAYAIRTCLENFGAYENVHVIPLYALANVL